MSADPITNHTVGELLNYDISDDDDPFADRPLNKARDDKSTLSPRGAKRRMDDDKENFGLGLDEEVKIVKKRKPIAKLDEARLLSQPGIPKLRALARSGKIAAKLRLKGKGHEFTDAGRLLNYFQLWLDDLYPRAKFADGLQLVEKVGHSKSMQRLRRDWIDEGKPGYLREKESRKSTERREIEDESEIRANGNIDAMRQAKQQETAEVTRDSIFGNGLDDEDMFFPESNTKPAREEEGDPEDDELEALLAEQGRRPHPNSTIAGPDSEGEDDLDALLAEQDSRRNYEIDLGAVSKVPLIFKLGEEEDEDDLEALLAEQQSRDNDFALPNPSRVVAPAPADTTDKMVSQEQETGAILLSTPIDNDLMDDDDLDALLAEQETTQQIKDNANILPPPPKTELSHAKDESQGEDGAVLFSSSPIPNDEFDD